MRQTPSQGGLKSLPGKVVSLELNLLMPKNDLKEG